MIQDQNNKRMNDSLNMKTICTFDEKNNKKPQNIITTLSVMQRTEYASNMYIYGVYTALTI